MEIAFIGNPPPRDVKPQLDKVLTLYGLDISEENYSRAGSVLVVLRQQYYDDQGCIVCTEMRILDETIASGGEAIGLAFPEAAAFAATYLYEEWAD